MGLPIMFGFLVVLQIMSRRTSSEGGRGKALIYATSHGDSSYDDETVSVGEQATQVLG